MSFFSLGERVRTRRHPLAVVPALVSFALVCGVGSTACSSFGEDDAPATNDGDASTSGDGGGAGDAGGGDSSPEEVCSTCESKTCWSGTLCAPAAFSELEPAGPSKIAVDGDELALAVETAVAMRGGVFRMTAPAFGQTAKPETVANSAHITSVTLNATAIMWTSNSDVTSEGGIWIKPRTGGTSQFLPGPMTAIAAYAGGAIAMEKVGTNVARITCQTGSDLCSREDGIGKLARAVAASDTVACYLGLASGVSGLHCSASGVNTPTGDIADSSSLGLTVQNLEVVLAGPEGLKIVRATSQDSESISTTPASGPVAMDGTTIYFASDAKLYRCERSRCAASVLQIAEGPGIVHSVAVSPQFVYFTAGGEGQTKSVVWRLAR